MWCSEDEVVLQRCFMPGMILELQDMKFDIVGFRKSVQAALEIQIRNAAREWLRAVILHVPTFTGETRGSLQPLGKFLRVAVPISPVAVRKGHSPATGAQQQLFTFSYVNGIYTFEYQSNVLQYKINEFYDVSHIIPLRTKVPWDSFIYGNAAFQAYAKNVIPKRIPRVTDFIKYDSIIVRP